MSEITSEVLGIIAREYFNTHQKTLVEYAAPYTIEELVRGFEQGRLLMHDLLDHLSDEQATFTPDSETYSISQVITHVLAAQNNAYNAMLDLSQLVKPHIEHTSYSPGSGAIQGIPVAALQSRLTNATLELVEVFRQAVRSEHQEQRVYPVFGQTDTKAWMLIQMLHDFDHIRQGQSLKKRVDFPVTSSETKSHVG